MNIGIIGAGVTGLTAAYRLARAGEKVTVFDRSPEVGGMVRTFQLGGTRLESFYHHCFNSDTDLVSLVEEMNLGARLRWKAPVNALWVPQGLYRFTTPGDLLRFRPLSLAGRVRFGLQVLGAKRVKDWKTLEGITARDWVCAGAGRDVWETLWGPLMRSKFGDSAEDVAAVWLWNKLVLRGGSRSKDLKNEELGYLEGSFGVLWDEVARRIRTLGGRICLGERVDRIVPREEGVELSVSGSLQSFDQVLFAAAPALLPPLAPDLPGDYAASLGELPYQANLCLCLKLEGPPLSPFYWISVAREDCPFVAAIEHTRLVDPAAYGGTVLYLSRYLDATDPLFSADDETVVARFLESLTDLYPLFYPDRVREVRLSRERYAQPVVGREYGARIPDLRTPLKGLYLASMSQIYPEDRGQSYAVRLGREAAEEMRRDVRRGL